ncbi:MAG: hypothetical protein ABIY55_22605 [Kofleriaceae bacterium]
MKLSILTLVPTLIPLWAACGTDVADPPPTTQVESKVTYWQDVEPIFYTNCASCHTAGGIGPFPIDDPEIAMNNARRIATEVNAKRMPPWPPGGDTPALRHTRSLSAAQIATIQAWADADAPLGDPTKPQPHVEPELVDIGPTQAAFDIGLDYKPDTSLSDDYRCFLADAGMTTAGVATGFEVTPGNRAVVHHVIVGLYAGSDRAALEALDAETPERAGWPCVGGLVPQDSPVKEVAGLGSWVPGVSAVAYPTGTGTPIPAGAVAVIQVHYNLLGGDDPDRTKVAIAMATPEAATSLIRLGGIGLIKHNLDIAVNDAASVHTQSLTVAQWRTLRGGQPFKSGHGYVLGAGGHMHLVGKRITITRSNASGDTTILDIPDWNFHWQGEYELQAPIPIDNTDTLTIRCEHDNSEQNRLARGLTPGVAVTWGEGTQDEMCLASVQVVETLP